MSAALRDKVAQALHGYNRGLAVKYRAESMVPLWMDESEYIREHYRNAADVAIQAIREIIPLTVEAAIQ